MSNCSLDDFLEACQAREPLGIDVIGAGLWESKRVRLDQPFALVGSHDQAHVNWRDPSLQPRHAYLQVVDGCVFGIDLETPNGTHWPGARRGCGWIVPDEALVVGSRKVRITHPAGSPDPTWNPLASGSLRQRDIPDLRLEIRLDGGPPTYWAANRVLFFIGTSRLCKVRLHRPEIAPFHASIINTRAGAWAVDLASGTGMQVNGIKTPVARLDPDSELTLGPFSIRICRLNGWQEAAPSD